MRPSKTYPTHIIMIQSKIYDNTSRFDGNVEMIDRIFGSKWLYPPTRWRRNERRDQTSELPDSSAHPKALLQPAYGG